MRVRLNKYLADLKSTRCIVQFSLDRCLVSPWVPYVVSAFLMDGENKFIHLKPLRIEPEKSDGDDTLEIA